MITLHFDLSGPLEECQAVLAQVGFPVPTSMTAAEQDALAKQELETAEKLKASRESLEKLDGKP